MAKVFDMTGQSFGSYLRATYGPWSSQDPFAQSSGTGVSFDNQYSGIESYEFGFLINTKRLTWRLGFEYVAPQPLNTVNGNDSASGANYYSLSSTVASLDPKLGVELNLKTWKESRLWFLGEGGIAMLDIHNNYTFTAAGTTKYGIGNFNEEVKSTGTVYAAGFGFETLMSDATTVSFELGYRYLNFTNLTEASGVTNFQGNVGSGASATQNGGAARTLNMSGPYAAVSLRVWIF